MKLFNFDGIPISKVQLKNWIENLMEASYIYGMTKGFCKGFWLSMKPSVDIENDVEEVKQTKLRIMQRFLDRLNEEKSQ